MKWGLLSLLGVVICNWYDIGNGQYSKKGSDQRIREAVLQDYNSDGWPSDSAVPVETSLTVMALMEASAEKSSIVMQAGLRFVWNDTRLKWDPLAFDGVEQITFDTSVDEFKIWTPDVKSLSLNGQVAFPDVANNLVQVDFRGRCYWSTPGKINIAHEFDLKNYPYDVQKVQIILIPWLSPTDKIVLVRWNPNSRKKTFGQDRVFFQHVMWDSQNFEYEITTKKYVTGTFSIMVFKMEIARRGSMIKRMIIAPGLLIALLCIFSFALPREAPIRLIFQNIIMMTVIMFIRMITNMPVSDKVPFVQQAFTSLYFLINVVVCIIIWSQNFYLKCSAMAKPPPKPPYHTYDQKIQIALIMLHQHSNQPDSIKTAALRKQAITTMIHQQVQQEITKPFLLRIPLFRPECIDIIGFILIAIAGILGLNDGILKIQV